MLQRIALLEALHSGCPLLLLDEPFSGLDPDGRDWAAGMLGTRLSGGAAVLLTDHSGAAGDRLALTARLRVGDGGVAAGPAATARARPLVTVTASHADGRRLERAVAESEGDDLLRELLAGGWHVEEVRR
jgi:ABC-type multidrug transport system ATPase subunit